MFEGWQPRWSRGHEFSTRNPCDGSESVPDSAPAQQGGAEVDLTAADLSAECRREAEAFSSSASPYRQFLERHGVRAASIVAGALTLPCLLTGAQHPPVPVPDPIPLVGGGAPLPKLPHSGERETGPTAKRDVQPKATAPSASVLFKNGSESLVARAVGLAEGTRYTWGGRTPAFKGHVDPGNGVWNLGTFSFQHEAKGPEDADRQQLQVLMKQYSQLLSEAKAVGLTLPLEDALNAIDLCNQAPAACLEDQGYVDWRLTAAKRGLKGFDAIVFARSRSFLDPGTGRLNASGLGNNFPSVIDDQGRRATAIRDVMNHFEKKFPEFYETLAPHTEPGRG